jgi:CheY-like chemotaxis protein
MAANADEAIRILESRNDIHVVFTDIQMPGSMDGVKLAHAVRDRWPPIQFIVVSGVTFDEGKLPEGSRFFSKPYEPSMIASAIREFALH